MNVHSQGCDWSCQHFCTLSFLASCRFFFLFCFFQPLKILLCNRNLHIKKLLLRARMLHHVKSILRCLIHLCSKTVFWGFFLVFFLLFFKFRLKSRFCKKKKKTRLSSTSSRVKELFNALATATLVVSSRSSASCVALICVWRTNAGWSTYITQLKYTPVTCNVQPCR